MKSKLKYHINECLHTEFANRGRVSGTGISEDNYDDESGRPSYGGSVHVMLPSDYLTPDERKALSGEVTIYRKDK